MSTRLLRAAISVAIGAVVSASALKALLIIWTLQPGFYQRHSWKVAAKRDDSAALGAYKKAGESKGSAGTYFGVLRVNQTCKGSDSTDKHSLS